MRILRLAIIAIAVLFLFAQFVRRTGMFYPTRFPAGDWNTASLATQPVDETFVTSDGVRLHGWWFHAADARAPTMIWFHGNAGNITDRGPTAAELAKRGVSVFVFDWRGYGRSEGSPSESKLYRDALAAYDFVAARTQDIALYGESLGGPYAAYVAKTRGHIRCVLIENSFPSLTALGNTLYRPFPLGWTAPFAMRTADWLNAAGVPVLVMHGRRDQVIPYLLGASLYEQLRTKKEMMTSDTAGHCEIPVVEAGRYYETVLRFIK